MKELLILAITTYQRLVSPWLAPACRFYPSCSEFGKQALETYGAFKGSILALERLLSCHPFHPGGYQPLIKNG